ncbi:MAG TPA: SBBP repeat-containing protein [Caldilineaceae bacterium]|nr:SBBP repeat-containing protein [Caldilineaceae bacterium]
MATVNRAPALWQWPARLLLAAAFTLAALLARPLIAQAQEGDAWVQSAGAAGDEEAVAVAVDGAGNVYITGSFRGTVDFDPGPGTAQLTSQVANAAYIIKLDPAGNLIWARSIQGDDDVRPYDLVVDPGGNVALTGSFEGTVDLDPGAALRRAESRGESDIFLVKLTAAGNLIWSFTAGDSGADRGIGLTADRNHNLYVAGSFRGTLTFSGTALGDLVLESAGDDDAIIFRFGGGGSLMWAKRMGGDESDEGRAVAVDRDGNVYMAGLFEGDVDLDPGWTGWEATSRGDTDIFISKLVAGGDFRTALAIGGQGEESEPDLAITGAGDLYLTGSFEREVDFDRNSPAGLRTSRGEDDIFLAKYSRNLNFHWVQTFGASGTDEGNGVALDLFENPVIIADFEGAVDFDPGNAQRTLTSAGQDDMVVANYTAGGDFRQAQAFGGSMDDTGRALALDQRGRVYLAGGIQGTAAFNLDGQTVSRTSAGGYDLVVAKLPQAVWTPALVGLYLPMVHEGQAAR